MTFFFTLPVATGFVPACSIQPEASIWLATPHTLRCLVIDGAWSAGYLFLTFMGLLFAVLALRKVSRLDASPERHQEFALHFARLLLIAGICLSLIALIQGNATNIDPTSSWRYLICTWVSLPAVLWPLWTCEQWLTRAWLPKVAPSLKFCALLLVFLVLTHSTVLIIQQDVPAAQADRQQMLTLEHTLEQQHITRFYSEYWTCNRIIFDTLEQLICGNTDDVNNHITHGFDRYLPYRSIVEHAPYPGFVFPTNAAQVRTLNQLLAQSHVQYQLIEVPGYVIYKMYGKIPSLPLYS